MPDLEKLAESFTTIDEYLDRVRNFHEKERKELKARCDKLEAALRELVRLVERGESPKWLCRVAKERPEQSALVKARVVLAEVQGTEEMK